MGKQEITPTLDNVLVEPIVEEKSKGGIYMPPLQRGDREIPSNYGKVIAVGPGRHEYGNFVETKLQVGAKVYYHTYPSGVACDDREAGRKFVLIPEKQIVAVVK